MGASPAKGPKQHLGLSQLIEQNLTDPRGTSTRLPLADLLRQSVYSRLAGYEDVNGAERLSQDPSFRLIDSKKIWDRGAALTSRLQSFETELLAEPENLTGLRTINRELIAKAEAMGSPQRVVLDIDSTEIPVYGSQEQSAYNGHFESTCYHPLLLFNREGDCLAAKLRPGNVHSADDWEELLLPVADQLAAATGEDRRALGEACPVLLAPVGRGPSDSAGVRGDFAADLGAAVTGGGKSWRLAGTKERRRKEGGDGGAVRELGRDAPKLPVGSGPEGPPPTLHGHW
jgi:hypothetical protein